MLLALLSYCGMLIMACFLTLCVAAGLYYLAEFVEEYSVLARRIITRSLQFVLVLHVLLLVESLPFWRLLFSAMSHLVYAMLLPGFPIIQLSDPTFLLGCALAIGNHFSWFAYFANTRTYGFMEIVSFFLFVVWLIPFMFFISLSASDNILPNHVSSPSDTHNKSKLGNVVKASIGWLFSKKDLFLPARSNAQKAI